MEEKIGERIGWSREKIRNHVTLRSQIGTEILVFAKTFQEGRVPDFGTNVPKNERGVTLRSKIGAEILVFAKSFQRDLAPKNGAFAPKNERGVTLRSKIGAEILVFAKSFQSGRAPSNGANAPKNERSVTSGLSGVILPLLYDKDSLLRCRNLLTYCRETSVFLAISLSDQFPHSISLSNVTHGGGRGERRRKMFIR